MSLSCPFIALRMTNAHCSALHLAPFGKFNALCNTLSCHRYVFCKVFVLYTIHYLFTICVVYPLPLYRGSMVTSCGTSSISKKSCSFCRPNCLFAFSRPRIKRFISSRCPFSKNFRACCAFISRSFFAARGVMRTRFISFAFCFCCLFFASFSCWYRNLSKLMMRATGGFACGAISTKSSPFSFASASASSFERTPMFSPRSSITRSSAAIMLLFVLCLGMVFAVIHPSAYTRNLSFVNTKAPRGCSPRGVVGYCFKLNTG